MPSLTDDLTQKAIQAALSNDWETAIKLNQEVLETQKDDVEALNRLARALFENGNLKKATLTYKKVLRLDPYNPIASKNLGRLSTLEGTSLKQNNTPSNLSPDLFLEEPGRTKIIKVVDLTSNKSLAALRVGGQLKLSSFHNDVKVAFDGKNLGKLEEELGPKIANALRSGSKFSAVVKSIQVKESVKDSLLSLFVKETLHSPKLPQPFFSLTTTNHFTPYVKEQALTMLNHQNEETHHDGENTEETDTHHDSGNPSSLERLAEKETEQDENDEEAS